MFKWNRNLSDKNGDVYEILLAQLSDYYFGEVLYKQLRLEQRKRMSECFLQSLFY